MRTLPKLSALAASIALMGALTACGGGPATRDQSTTSTSMDATPVEATQMPKVPKGLEAFYTQKLSWEECGDGFQCATAKAPLDYDNPDGTKIDIALKKLPASSGKPIGTLYLNPGGPGGSGVEYVENVRESFSADLLSAFDVVGFDPRGVGQSTSVQCQADGETEAPEDAVEGEELSAADANKRAAEETAAMCEAHTKPVELLDHVDTVSVAKDLDMLRALAGDPQLYYIGFSYGTLLGATYAEHFPGNVGRLVLDGAVDPALSSAELSKEQGVAFEKSLEAFVAECQKGADCPFEGDTAQGVKQIRDFLDQLEEKPLPVDGKDDVIVTREDVTSLLSNAFYEDTVWPAVAKALGAAFQGDGTAVHELLALFEEAGGAEGDEAKIAIDCLDYPIEGNQAEWDKQADELKEVAPVFGTSYVDLFCQAWGHHGTEKRTEIKAKGAAPVLVVGTTGDPATPYAWSESLAKQMESATLLTWEGNGHTAYGRAGECVTKAVDDYLLRGKLPEDGLVCKG
ncbi:MAG: alpha/beta hydrolase [Actinomycetaceae bacterium]|nr:alpha/beta hydrolase [Actinomycetaceae bacterium]